MDVLKPYMERHQSPAPFFANLDDGLEDRPAVRWLLQSKRGLRHDGLGKGHEGRLAEVPALVAIGTATRVAR